MDTSLLTRQQVIRETGLPKVDYHCHISITEYSDPANPTIIAVSKDEFIADLQEAEIDKAVDVLSTATAKMFGLADKGEIRVGKDADIVIFDPEQKFTITQKKLHMNVDYTPFEGMEVTGMPVEVYVRGKKVSEWKNDHVEFVGEKGYGKFVKREPLMMK